MDVMRDAIGWLSVLLALSGAVLSALHVRRSTWAVVIAAGFGLQAFAMAFTRIAIVLMSRGDTGSGTIPALFLLTSLLGMAGSAAIIAGLAGVLAQLKQATEAAGAPETLSDGEA